MLHTAIYTETEMASVAGRIQPFTKNGDTEKCGGDAQPFGQRVEQVLKLTQASLRWGDASGVQSPGEAWWPDGGLPDGGPGLNLESWGIDSGPAV